MENRTSQIKRVFVFAHGWAGTGQCLLPLIERLRITPLLHSNQNQFLSLEQHYFSDAQPCLMNLHTNQIEPQDSILSENAQWVGVGHSLGFAHLLQQQINWNALISLHGFTRFTAQPPFQAGTPKRILQRMIQQFNKDPNQVLNDFWLRSGHTINEQPRLISPNLLSDLQWMQDLDLTSDLQTKLHSNCSVLMIDSPLDAIVPGALIDECVQTLIDQGEAIPLKRVSLETSHEGFTQSLERYTSEITDFLKPLAGP